MNNVNTKYINILKAIFQPLKSESYIVLGSAATLSFTSKRGYSRKMNDLDVIADESVVVKIKKTLFKEGFQQSTFIDKRMPFFNNLIKHSDSVYLRFSKNGINVEVLSTLFVKKDRFMKFDLYPDIWVSIPEDCLVTTSLGNSRFTTLVPDLLWAIKQFLNNTLGRIMFHKRDQRNKDLRALKEIANISKSKEILSKCRFGYKSLSFKVPPSLLN